jgi:hypothetical protein
MRYSGYAFARCTALFMVTISGVASSGQRQQAMGIVSLLKLSEKYLVAAQIASV